MMFLFLEGNSLSFPGLSNEELPEHTQIHSVIAHHRAPACSLKIEIFGVSICLFDSSVLNFETCGAVKFLSDNGVPELSRAK